MVGIKPVPDALGRVNKLEVIPLEELGRPRVDVVVNCSGVFRDLFVNQMNLLDRAVKMAAELDEPEDMNFVRKHARQQVKCLSFYSLHVCLCVCVYLCAMYVHVCVSVCLCICVSVCLYVVQYACSSVPHLHVCMHICLCVWAQNVTCRVRIVCFVQPEEMGISMRLSIHLYVHLSVCLCAKCDFFCIPCVI